MRDESSRDSWSELKASKPKMIFLAVLVIFGVLGLFNAFVDDNLPGMGKEFTRASYSDLMIDIYAPGQTTAQRQARKNQYVGKWVEWSGSVVDVSQKGRAYVVSVSASPSAVLTDIYLRGVSEDEALGLKRGAQIAYTGKIDHFEDGLLTGYVHLARVSLE